MDSGYDDDRSINQPMDPIGEREEKGLCQVPTEDYQDTGRSEHRHLALSYLSILQVLLLTLPITSQAAGRTGYSLRSMVGTLCKALRLPSGRWPSLGFSMRQVEYLPSHQPGIAT